MIASLKSYAQSLTKNLLGSTSESKQKAINYKDLASYYPEIEKSDWGVVIFIGNEDPWTGRNWCPDCVRAEPHIEKKLMPFCKEKNIPIHFVEVGGRDEWKDKKHPLRLHKMWQIVSIPTIVLLNKGRPQRKISDHHCENDEYLELLLEDLE